MKISALVFVLALAGCVINPQRPSSGIYEACANTVAEYAFTRDAVDTERYAAVFTEDAVFTLRGATTTGRAALVEALITRASGPKTRHLVGSIEITQTGPDTARGRSYASVYAMPEGDRSELDPFLLALVSYTDKFQFEDEVCRIQSRNTIIDYERPSQ